MEEGLAKVPKLELAQFKFVISKEISSTSPNRILIEQVKEKLLAGIKLDSEYLGSILKYINTAKFS